MGNVTECVNSTPKERSLCLELKNCANSEEIPTEAAPGTYGAAPEGPLAAHLLAALHVYHECVMCGHMIHSVGREWMDFFLRVILFKGERMKSENGVR